MWERPFDRQKSCDWFDGGSRCLKYPRPFLSALSSFPFVSLFSFLSFHTDMHNNWALPWLSIQTVLFPSQHLQDTTLTLNRDVTLKCNDLHHWVLLNVSTCYSSLGESDSEPVTGFTEADWLLYCCVTHRHWEPVYAHMMVQECDWAACFPLWVCQPKLLQHPLKMVAREQEFCYPFFLLLLQKYNMFDDC